MTTRKKFPFITFSWTVACDAQIFAFLGYHFNNSNKACEFAPRLLNEFIMYVKFLVSFVFWFSLISMTAFYGRVIWELRRKQNQIFNREQLAVNRGHKRITFMVITVTLIFTATWGAGSAINVWFLTNN